MHVSIFSTPNLWMKNVIGNWTFQRNIASTISNLKMWLSYNSSTLISGHIVTKLFTYRFRRFEGRNFRDWNRFQRSWTSGDAGTLPVSRGPGFHRAEHREEGSGMVLKIWLDKLSLSDVFKLFWLQVGRISTKCQRC